MDRRRFALGVLLAAALFALVAALRTIDPEPARARARAPISPVASSQPRPALAHAAASAPAASAPAPEPVPVPVPDSAPPDAPVPAPQGKPISGRVVDRSGNPLPGIEVTTPRYSEQKAITTEDGAFTVHGPEPGSWQPARAAAVDPAQHYAWWTGVLYEGIVIELGTWASVAGRVIERGSGRPIPGAYVVLPGHSYYTDADGGFVFDRLEPHLGGVFASKEGYATACVRYEVHAGEQAELVIELGAGGAIAGRVVTGDGKPVAGAAIVVSSKAASVLGVPDHFPGFAQASTDVGGGFVLEDREPGRHVVTATAPDLAPAMVEVDVPADGGRAEATIVLEAGGAIEGTVRDADGRPVPSAYVVGELRDAPRRQEVDVGPDGSYRIGGLAAGIYEITAGDRAEERQSPATIVRVAGEGGPARADLVLHPAAMITGTVRAGGRPLKDGQIELYRLPERDGPQRDWLGGEDGQYHIRALPGRYEMVVPPYGPRLLEVPPGAREVRFDLELPSFSVQGQVVDAEGRGLAGAVVEALPEGETSHSGWRLFWHEVGTDETGSFLIDGLDEGPFVFVASREGSGSARAGPFEVGPATPPIAIRFAGGGEIEARVFGADGPAVWAYLVLMTEDGREIQTSEPSELGAPKLVCVAPGTYTILAAAWYTSFALARDVAFDGTSLELDLRLPVGGLLVVSVRDRESGLPVGGARVDLELVDGFALPPALPGRDRAPRATDAEGFFHRSHLAPGGYRGRVRAEDGREAELDFAIEAGETTEVVVELP